MIAMTSLIILYSFGVEFGLVGKYIIIISIDAVALSLVPVITAIFLEIDSEKQEEGDDSECA
jgi:hypothetical protein